MTRENRSAATAVAATMILMVAFMFSLQTAQAEEWMLKVRKEKISNLHFYFHDTLMGRNVTAVRVASAATTQSSTTLFGAVNVIDDFLTEGPEPTSKVVGRAQGLYTSACQQEARLLMAVTYVFQSGEFKGSSLALVGNNPVFHKVREMPIVGGSGAFRLARGYALARTHSFDLRTGNAIVAYNVTVLHY